MKFLEKKERLKSHSINRLQTYKREFWFYIKIYIYIRILSLHTIYFASILLKRKSLLIIKTLQRSFTLSIDLFVRYIILAGAPVYVGQIISSHAASSNSHPLLAQKQPPSSFETSPLCVVARIWDPPLHCSIDRFFFFPRPRGSIPPYLRTPAPPDAPSLASSLLWVSRHHRWWRLRSTPPTVFRRTLVASVYEPRTWTRPHRKSRRLRCTCVAFDAFNGIVPCSSQWINCVESVTTNTIILVMNVKPIANYTPGTRYR